MAAKRPKNERSVFKSNQQSKEKQKAANSVCVFVCVPSMLPRPSGRAACLWVYGRK